jgi:hypothetical protein
MTFPDLLKKVNLPDLEAAAAGLVGCVSALSSSFPDLRVVDDANLEVRRAVRQRLGSRLVLRHAEQDGILLSLMKLVRIASANNAALELISAGYAQEAHVLWRMIDAAYEDIVSMAGPLADPRALSDDRGGVIDSSFQLEPPRVADAVRTQANYLFRSLLATALVARGANRADVVERARSLATELARTTGCLDAHPSAS